MSGRFYCGKHGVHFDPAVGCHECQRRSELLQPPCSAVPDAAAIPWLEGVRSMIRDRQYEIKETCDEMPPKRYPVEYAARSMVLDELEPIADLINRMIHRIHQGESGKKPNDKDQRPSAAGGKA